MKRIWILTLFPEFIESFSKTGVISQAFSSEESNFELHIVNIRDFALDKYKSVDDTPFGGGPGMVMKADVLFEALDKGVRQPAEAEFEDLHVIYTSPRGRVWNRDCCHEFAKNQLTNKKELVFICGRYEGIDERFLEKYVDEYISIGDFVLTGGEIAVMTILDSSLRLVPGVLGNSESFQQDSFENGLIEYPQYTRPREFQGAEIPEVLLSGHHKNIQEYQQQKQEELTQKHRTDLWDIYQKKQSKKS